MAKIEGGWSFTAYSNREAFAMEVARGFSTTFAARRMEDLGTYPGNALNTMIERDGDRRYIEAGNLAVLQCHGNPYSVDVEFIPRIEYSLYMYEWGERGKLQWVFCSGCDVLGFPAFPDGRPSHLYPDPRRWEGSFKGISGVLGYRSGSWYQANNSGLGRMFGNLLAEELVNGRTFWAAWRAASDFLHRRIGQQAEICAFVSSPAAFSDTLQSYVLDRIPKLDINAIRRSIVGHGAAPLYHYCERVDESGNYVCDGAAKHMTRVGIAEGLTISPKEVPTRLTLPLFDNVETSTIAEVYGRFEYRLEGDMPRISAYGVSVLGPDEAVLLHEGISQEYKRTAKNPLRLVDSGTGVHEGRVLDARHAVFVDGQRFDLFNDFGHVVEEIAGQTVSRGGCVLEAKKPSSTMLIEWNHETIFQAFRQEILGGAQVHVERVAVMYQARIEGGLVGVYPVVVCYAVMTAHGSQRCIVRAIG